MLTECFQVRKRLRSHDKLNFHFIDIACNFIHLRRDLACFFYRICHVRHSVRRVSRQFPDFRRFLLFRIYHVLFKISLVLNHWAKHRRAVVFCQCMHHRLSVCRMYNFICVGRVTVYHIVGFAFNSEIVEHITRLAVAVIRIVKQFKRRVQILARRCYANALARYVIEFLKTDCRFIAFVQYREFYGCQLCFRILLFGRGNEFPHSAADRVHICTRLATGYLRIKGFCIVRCIVRIEQTFLYPFVKQSQILFVPVRHRAVCNFSIF